MNKVQESSEKRVLEPDGKKGYVPPSTPARVPQQQQPVTPPPVEKK